MTVATSRGRMNARVFLVETHHLAKEFLLGLLAHRFKIELHLPGVETQKRTRKKRDEHGQVVLVIDRGALKIPFQECLRTLNRDFPQSKKLVLDADLADDEICSLLNFGIDGFVPYALIGQLPRAISAVVDGHVWTPLRILEHYVSYVHDLSQAKRKSHDELSAREEEILQLLQRKLSNKEISSALAISESTVKFHLVRIFQKLGVHSRHELSTSSEISNKQRTLGFREEHRADLLIR